MADQATPQCVRGLTVHFVHGQHATHRFEKKGMTKRALGLIKGYLFKRFSKVVCEGDISTLKQIFSAVHQGAVWPPDFWDFDISELPEAISSEGDEFYYHDADDVGLWYEITAEIEM